MAVNEWNLLSLFYNLIWLVFLTHKHYGQVSTRAGHIFELNVLLNNTIYVMLWIFIVDLEVIPWCTIASEILDKAILYSFLIAVANSQIETALFLKTLNVNTMMTNTAGKIIFAMSIFCLGMGVIVTLALPCIKGCQPCQTVYCDYLTPKGFYHMTIPGILVLLVVLTVMVFALFRAHQIRRKRDTEEPNHEIGTSDRNDTPSNGRLFTIQSMIFEINQETTRDNVEDDLIVQDINPINVETSPSFPSNQVMINLEETSLENDMNEMTENQQYQVGCVPVPVNMIMKTIQKYLKNTLLSLLIMTSQLPWYSTAMYAFITNSGCENTTIQKMLEISEYGLLVLNILLPYLIKLKLDRLSE